VLLGCVLGCRLVAVNRWGDESVDLVSAVLVRIQCTSRVTCWRAGGLGRRLLREGSQCCEASGSWVSSHVVMPDEIGISQFVLHQVNPSGVCLCCVAGFRSSGVAGGARNRSCSLCEEYFDALHG